MASAMTLEEILEVLRAGSPVADSPGYRVEEIREATGMGEERIRREVGRGLKDGTVRRVQRQFHGIDGRRCTVWAYEFLEPTPLVKGKKR